MRIQTGQTALPQGLDGTFGFLRVLQEASGAVNVKDGGIKQAIASVYGEDAEDVPDEWEVLDSDTEELPEVDNFKYISDENALGAGGMFYIVEGDDGRDKVFVVYNTFKAGETDLYDWLKGLRVQVVEKHGEDLRAAALPEGYKAATDETPAPHTMDFTSIEMIDAGVARYTTKSGDKIYLDVQSPDGKQVYDSNLSDAKMALFQHVLHAYRMRFDIVMPGSAIQKVVSEHNAWIVDPGSGDERAKVGDITPEVAQTGVFHDVDYNGTIDLILIKTERGSLAVVPGTTDEDRAYFEYAQGEVERFGTDPSILKYGSRFSDPYKNGDLEGFSFATGDTSVPGVFDIDTVEQIQNGDEKLDYIRYTTKGGDKVIADPFRSPEHFDASLRALKLFQLRDEGAVVVQQEAATDIRDIGNVSSSDTYPAGLLTFERGGKTHVVHSEINPNVYSAAAKVRAQGANEEAKGERGDDLAFLDDLDIMSAQTDTPVEKGGKNATVMEFIFKKLVEKYGGTDFKDKNDPRFKFLQAFRAISAGQQGMTITPFVENVRWAGAHTSRAEGKKRDLTAADMEDFINSDAAYELYFESLNSKEVQADYDAFFNEALGQVDGVENKRDRLRALVGDPTKFLDYIRGLQETGKRELAEQEMQKVTDAINMLLDGDEAADAIMAITLGGTTSDLDDLVSHPDRLENSAYNNATASLIALLLRSASLTAGAVRRTLETIRALNDSSPEALAKVLKEMQRLYLEVGDSMGNNHGQPTAEAIRQAVGRGLQGLGEKVDANQFSTSFLDLNKHGLLGSFVGGIGITTGVMKLTNWNERSGSDGLIDGDDYSALSVARDFINALSLNTSFFVTFDSGMKLLKSGGVVDMLGLSGTLPEVWGENGVMKDYRSKAPDTLADEIARSSGNTLNSSAPVNLPDGADDARATGYVGRMLEGIGVNPAAPKVLSTGVGTVLRVLSSLADIGLGVVDIILGALNVRGNISGTSPGTGGLQIFAGILEATAGVAGAMLMFGKGGNWAKFIMSGALSGALITTLVSLPASIAIADQDSRFDAQLKYFQDLDEAGLLDNAWGEKLEYAMYALYDGKGGYGSRDAPGDVSIFDYQWREFEHFRNTGQSKGSSRNRLEGDLRFEGDGTDWRPKSAGDDDSWFDADDPLKGLEGQDREVVLQTWINKGIENSEGIRVYLDPNDYDRKVNWNEKDKRFEDAATGDVLVFNEDDRRYDKA